MKPEIVDRVSDGIPPETRKPLCDLAVFVICSTVYPPVRTTFLIVTPQPEHAREVTIHSTQTHRHPQQSGQERTARQVAMQSTAVLIQRTPTAVVETKTTASWVSTTVCRVLCVVCSFVLSPRKLPMWTVLKGFPITAPLYRDLAFLCGFLNNNA